MGVAVQPKVGLDLFRLDGRVALVTGGSKGLGAAIAEGLASAGADLVIASRHHGEAGSTAGTISSATGRRVLGLEGDVSDERAVDDLVNTTLAEFGRIDILVNSAAISVRGAVEEVSRADFDRCWAINVTGTWMMCRAVLPGMRENRYGRILNISSTAGLVGASERSAYAATKGAVIQITRSLALECARDGVTVNAIAPGPFLTPMTEPVAHTDRLVRVINSEVPMARWGDMHEIQGAAIFLASDASSYVTGSVNVVDGGMTAR